MPFYPPIETSFELPPAGMHPARCWSIIDLGTQNYPYNGEDKIARYLLVNWELSIADKMTNGKPYAIGRRWRYSSHEKSTMRRDLEAWLSRKFRPGEFCSFDITSILGMKCMLNVQHVTKDDTEYANIVGIAPAVKGIEFEPSFNDHRLLILEKGSFDQDVFDGLSEKLRDRIKESPEYKQLKNPNADAMAKLDEAKRAITMEAVLDDEIPF
jgi:hypothetical protein